MVHKNFLRTQTLDLAAAGGKVGYMTTKTFTATTLARMADCHRNTVSNYTKAGVLTPITLSDGTRAYGPDDLARLREIAASRKRKREGEGDG